jgi:hypothetical protein
MKKFIATLLIVIVIAPLTLWSQTNVHGRIIVSENKRFLQYEDGTPFFYLGETAWELFHRCNREEADMYLRNRAEKGYTVIQSVVLAELDGLNTPNSYDNYALTGNNPETPNEEYFKHVDFVIDLAATYGLVMGVLPTWGDKVNSAMPVFNETNAFDYGKFLGNRYKDKKNIIWILGGDRPCNGYENIWRAIAKGIVVGVSGKEDYSKVTMTLHPCGGCKSSDWFHNDEWLDFNMQQNGHCYTTDTWNRIASDYNKLPIKPVIDGEPLYEEHPICFDPAKNGTSTDYHCRRYLYHDLFSGAMGHTYGCHAIWQMFTKDRSPINHPLRSWQESLNLPGAFQMQYARYLLEAHPYFSRIPDQSMILSSQGDNNTRITATRDSEGTYALVYTEAGLKFKLDLTKLSGKQNKAWWFDPRNGRATYFGTFGNDKPSEFIPPSSGIGNDWVLVLDDATKNYTLATGEKTDFISPSTPGKLSVTNISPVGATMQWQPSTDNVLVSGYHIFLNNKLVAATTENKIELNNLMPETEYIVSIKSIDEALNYSVSSDSITFKTTKDLKIKTINISGPSGKLELGKNFQLNATVLPEKVIFKKLSWYAEDTTVVKVSNIGLVAPLKPGKTVVYAKSGEVVSNKISLIVDSPLDVYTANYTPDKLIIDGILSEKVWGEMSPATKSFDLKTDNQIFFKVLWDSTYLYVGAKITDRSLFSDSESPWDDDAVEIYVDGNGNKASSYDQFDRQFVCSFDKPIFESRGKVTGVVRKIVKTNAGFDLEMAIPWSNIGIKPNLNQLIGFDISNTNDLDGNGRDCIIFWKGNPMNWADTRGFGNVVLEKQ